MLRRIALTAACFMLGAALAEDVNTVFEVPKLSNIVINGKGDDWGDQGLKVDNLKDVNGKKQAANNFTPAFRLGWDERGLLVLINVIDDIASEPATKNEELWKGDSIEMFMATDRGSDSNMQVVIAPGRDPNHNALRMNISDYRKEKKGKLEIQAERSITDAGYVIEVLLPWKNFEIEAKDGTNLGFQFYANDVDKGEDRYQALWFPKPETHQDSNNMYRLKLVEKAAAPAAPVAAPAAPKSSTPEKPAAEEKTTASAVLMDDGKAEVTVTAPASLAGKKLEIKDGDKTMGKGKLEAEGDKASAKIKLNKPKDKEKGYGTLSVMLDEQTLTTVEVKK